MAPDLQIWIFDALVHMFEIISNGRRRIHTPNIPIGKGGISDIGFFAFRVEVRYRGRDIAAYMQRSAPHIPLILGIVEIR